MNPIVLPSALDRVSANVLYFDAQAYLNDEPSKLHERINIPNSPINDTFVTTNKKNKKITFTPKSLVDTVLKIGAGIGLAYLGVKNFKKGGLTKKAFARITNLFTGSKLGTKIKNSDKLQDFGQKFKAQFSGIGKTFDNIKNSNRFQDFGQKFKVQFTNIGEQLKGIKNIFPKK